MTSERNVLLLHDGELADVRAVLDEIGISSWEALDSATPPAWDVEFATPRHLYRLASITGWRPNGYRVAVAERDSRALRVLVQRCAVDGVVCRPVHPTALRLLIKHAIHPERVPGWPRVAVGAPVDVHLNLRYMEGILADLSLDGCRLLTERPISRGQRLVIATPSEAGERRWFLYGEVVREIQEPDHAGASSGVRFQHLLPDIKRGLEDVFEFYRRGPATFTFPSHLNLAIPTADVATDPEILLTEVFEGGNTSEPFR